MPTRALGGSASLKWMKRNPSKQQQWNTCNNRYEHEKRSDSRCTIHEKDKHRKFLSGDRIVSIVITIYRNLPPCLNPTEVLDKLVKEIT
jgi:hypothetical protein